jgi:hypothetical protein
MDVEPPEVAYVPEVHKSVCIYTSPHAYISTWENMQSTNLVNILAFQGKVGMGAGRGFHLMCVGEIPLILWLFWVFLLFYSFLLPPTPGICSLAHLPDLPSTAPQEDTYWGERKPCSALGFKSDSSKSPYRSDNLENKTPSPFPFPRSLIMGLCWEMKSSRPRRTHTQRFAAVAQGWTQVYGEGKRAPFSTSSCQMAWDMSHTSPGSPPQAHPL